MKHISVNKPLKRCLRGNATGLNMMGQMTSQQCLQMKENQKKQASRRRNPTPKEVKVVLSSDDDDEETEVLTRRVTRPSRAVPDTSNPSPSPSSGSVESSVDEDITSDYFADYKLIPKIRLPRKMLMQNKLGKLLRKKPSVQQTETREEEVPSAARRGRSEVDVDCRLVRVGTMCRKITQRVTFNPEYIQIDHQVCVPAKAVTGCELCLSRGLPSLLLKTTPGEGLRLRYHLNMYDGRGGGWFHSEGSNLGEKYIILVFMDLLSTPDRCLLEDILTEMGRENGVDDFVRTITFEEANKILMHGKTDPSADGSIRSPSSPPAPRDGSSLKTSPNASFPTAASHTPLAFQQAFLDRGPGTVSRMHPYPPLPKFPPQPAASHKSPAKARLRPQTPPPRPPPSQTPPPQPPSLIGSSGSSEDEDVLEVFSGPVKRLIMYPPPPARGGIAITNEDLHRLNKGEFLNDVIIDFFLKYLVLAELREEDVERSHIFSSFFYKRLTQPEDRRAQGSDSPPKKIRHNGVRTWTKNLDLFQKDFIFVPINESAHWFLAVICFPGLEVPQRDPETPSPASSPGPGPGPLSRLRREQKNPMSAAWGGAESCVGQDFSFTSPGSNPMSLFFRGRTKDGGRDCDEVCSEPAACRRPCILIMDSLGGHGDRVVEILQEYLEVEWEVRRGSRRRFCGEAMAGCRPSVPQQDNLSDCGLYLLQYIQSFFQNPPCSFTPPMDLRKWFPQKRVGKKRGEIKQLILAIHRQQELDSSN